MFLLVIFSFINSNNDSVKLPILGHPECDKVYIKLYQKNGMVPRKRINLYMLDTKTNQGRYPDTNHVFRLPKCNYGDTLSLVFRNIKVEPIDTVLFKWKNVDTIYIGYEISKKRPIR